MPIGYAYFTIGMIALIVFVPYLRHEHFGRIVSMLAYRRGFLNVACPRGKAMRRPGYVGQVTDTDSHAFLYIDVNIHLLPMRKSGSGWSEKLCVIMVECRLVFEHLMRDAFHCERADFSFVNADCYDAGIEKHPEIKAYMVCALIALARNENYSSFSSELLKLAKLIDGRNKFSNADFDSALEHVKQIIPEL